MNREGWVVTRRAGRAPRIVCGVLLLLGGPRAPAAGTTSRIEAPFGLADRHHCQRFAQDFVHVLHQRWRKLQTPRERGQALIDEMNERLKGAGVPKVEFEVSEAAAPLGFFNPYRWRVYIARASLTSPWLDEPAAAELGDTIYHEACHAEQWLLALRWHFDQGLDPARLSTSQIPRRVEERARKKKRLAPGSAEERLAARWHKSLFGDERAMHRQILDALATTRKRWEELRGSGSTAELAHAWQRYQAALSLYRALPDEADAFAAAAVMKAALLPRLARRRHEP